MKKKSAQFVVLLLMALPMMGAPCTEDKIIDVVIGFPSTALVEASGTINMVTGQSDDFDLKADVDVQGALDDAGIDVHSIGKDPTTQTTDVKVVQVLYRVIEPDQNAPDRTITNASLSVARIDQATGQPNASGTPVFISNWSANAGSGNVGDPTAWIDVTNLLGQAGLDLLNGYIYDLVCCLQDGTPMTDPVIRYRYSGTSAPTTVDTFFRYEVRVIFQGTISEEYEIPFG